MAESTKVRPMQASFTSGRRRSIHASSAAPHSALVAAMSCTSSGCLGEIEQSGNDDAESGDLRDGKIGEDHAALQHAHAERNVRGKYQQTRDERGQQDVEFDAVHGVLFQSRQ